MENLGVEKQAKRILMTFTICPCCGAKSIEHSAAEDCHACGARAVGAPLAPPDNLLPSYWSAFGAFAFGAALLIAFLVLTLAAWFTDKSLSFDLRDFVAAGEVAAWRLKWLAFPASLLALCVSRRALRRVRTRPTRFTGVRLARFGVNASASFALAVALLIGMAIPAHWQQRELAQRAKREAFGYTILNRFLAYKTHFGTFPREINNLEELKKFKEFADDEAIDALLIQLKDAKYEPTTDIATTLPANDAKSRMLRGNDASARVRQVSLTADTEINAGRIDDVQGEMLPFTSFKIKLSGEEDMFGKDDDLELTEDGFVSPSALPSANARAVKPFAPTTSRRAH